MASAKKRVELIKQRGTVQINTTVDDTQKSIEELINAGLRTHNERGSKHFNKNNKLPNSFWRPAKTRCSSGHSRDSSDDGFGSSAGRHTLSPSSVSSFGLHHVHGTIPSGMDPNQSGAIHQRQASAPALINYEQYEAQAQAQQQQQQQQQQQFANAVVGDQQQQRQHQHQFHAHHHIGNPKARSALPPLAHPHHAYSRSLNAMAASPPQPQPGSSSSGSGSSAHQQHANSQMFLSAIGSELPPVAHHRAAKSCDFDMMGAAAVVGGSNHPLSQPTTALALGMGGGGQPHSIDLTGAGGLLCQQQQQPDFGAAATAFSAQQQQQQQLVSSSKFQQQQHSGSPTQYWANARAKSQSLDPITFESMAAVSSPPFHPQQHQHGQFPPAQQPNVSNHSVPSPQQQQHAAEFMHQPPFLGGGPHQSPPQEFPGMQQNMLDDGMGLMPKNWEKAFDQNGDPYFIDHANKTTTWFDPRLPKEVQEAMIISRHSQRGRQQQQQQQQQEHQHRHHSSLFMAHHNQQSSAAAGSSSGISAGPGTSCAVGAVRSCNGSPLLSAHQQHSSTGANVAGVDRVQQLKQEQQCMQERREQIRREGLLDSTFLAGRALHHHPHPHPHHHHPHPSGSSIGDPSGPPPHHSLPSAAFGTMPPGALNPPTFLQRPPPAQSATEMMEIDSAFGGQPGGGGYIGTIFQDLNAADLNPQEFDKYLYINDNNNGSRQAQQNMAQ